MLGGKGWGLTRVEKPQADSPQTVGQILRDQIEYPYTLGYVPAGTRSLSLEATRSFTPLDPIDMVIRSPTAPKPADPVADSINKQEGQSGQERQQQQRLMEEQYRTKTFWEELQSPWIWIGFIFLSLLSWILAPG